MSVNRRAFLASSATVGAAMAMPGVASAEGRPTLGPVTITPGDPRFEDLVLRGQNDRFTPRPESFRVVGSTDQVVRVVGEAVRAGKRVSVRSGGHCYENFVGDPQPGVVIDMVEMNDVYYDQERRAFVIQPGALLSDVYQTLYFGWDVTIPGGQCGTVAAGGHILGGGYGPLSRRDGSVVDYLYAVEVVVVERNGQARAIVATREPDDPHRDLWWAHAGGGGGNFGIVTKYWMRSPGATGNDPSKLLPRPPSATLGGVMIWNWPDLTKDRFRRLLTNHGQWYERNTAPDTLASVFMINGHKKGQPPPPPLAGDLFLTAQIDAGAPNAERYLRGYFEAISDGVGGTPIISPQPTPWLTSVQRSVQGVGEIGRQKNKAAYLRRRYNDHQLDTLYAQLSNVDPSLAVTMLWLVSYGGKVNTVDPAATALADRDSLLKTVYIAAWEDPAADDAHIKWIRQFYKDVYAETGGVPVPNEVNGGSYINYPDIDLADPAWNTSGVPWSTLYYKGNYPRLQRIKAKYDPRDVFTHKLGIRPA
ncbi:FAD-binding oxidoreductase [Kibdelosporangium aridum]|uniref:FAD-binding oxidoreductase n=1 Tax=Kibdelosporangium aridum TaxID=2030 RepID=A0A428ZEU1_KIBAR|nr:FAD-binding protein [Kibdelosporangium aridum]RSM86579.1 FAD-binding oxidoreductase [Kibdelosporangium aridum]